MHVSPIRSPEGAGVHLAVAGVVDLATGGALRAAIHAALEAGPCTEVVVDLSRVWLLDRHGLTILIQARTFAAERHTTLRITDPRGIVRKALHLTGTLETLMAAPPVPVAAAH